LKTCFLIDDDEDDRDIFELALGQLGAKFRFVTSESCIAALETLRNGELNPDYIFLDLNMPVVTGRECLVEIRKLAKFQTTPVLIYTTSSVQKDKEDVMRLGATSFITKPNKVSALTLVLREVLNP
jgi:CheY-like chemotaxis protein